MRVAVIGAGASGLTAAKALREAGSTPVVYEASADIGGLWVYREHSNGGGPAYRSLRTNTSKQITAFSDAPFPPTTSDFPSGAEVERYLEDYAVAFDLMPLVQIGCRVRCLRPMPGGWWQLTVGSDGVEATEMFDAVLICTGIFRQPVVPVVPGLEGYRGQVLHSLEYRVAEIFAGRDVLVVGLGSSAVDIAVDLAGSAASVTLSTRRGAWVAPRVADGRPVDHRGTRLSLLLPASQRARSRQRLLLQEYARRGIEAPAAIWRKARVPFHPDTAPGVTSDGLLPCIMSGRIRVRPGIARFERGAVVFADGSMLWPDVVIFCTGYGLDFPFLPVELAPWSDHTTGLYRLVFPPDHPTLAFIGVCRVHGPVLPIVEMQARWAARVLTGKVDLPRPAVMRAEIRRRWHTQMSRHDSPIRVPLLAYLDEVGELIGARPSLGRHPGLLVPLLTGPPVGAQYRLDGPDRWTGAARVIRSAGD